MQSLGLNIENGIRIYLDMIVLENILGKTLFVMAFDVLKFLAGL